ncbi:MAG: hypothetical protein GEU75_00785 [Dehalococcoidia bacterium]|nr:hypothetical protein [Dehalococcoidia bacterium]
MHLLGNVSPRALTDEFFNQQPVGSGPYRLAELTPERAVLEANPAHHLGQPFIQRLELRFYRHEGLLLSALEAGQIDGAFFSRGLGPVELQELQQRTSLRLSAFPTGETAYVYFNLRLPVFQDRRVRQALLYALDRDALVTDVFDGQALRADSPLSAGTWAYSDALGRYDPDPNVAAALLSEAGWLPGPDGVRRRAGLDLAFTLAVNNDPVRVTVANQIAGRWSAIGVRATVEASGATNIVRELIEPRDFEALLFANVVQDDPDPYLAWHSSQTGPRGANLSSLRDDRIDGLLEEARLLAAPERRATLYAEFQEVFAQEVPAIPLYTSTVLYAQKAALKGVRIGYLDNPGARFWQVYEWHLRTR